MIGGVKDPAAFGMESEFRMLWEVPPGYRVTPCLIPNAIVDRSLLERMS
jgi:hypothetical protein